MTEQDLVGEQTPEGANGNQPSVSQGEGKPIASNAAESQDFVSKKEFDTLMKELRGLQSRQDKSQSEQTRFMDELRAQMAKGLSLDEAEKAVHENAKAREKDELLYKMAEKLGVSGSFSQPTTAGNSSDATVDVAKVVGSYGLDANDPEVVSQVLGKKFNSELEAENAALKIAYRRANSNPPNPAASTAIQGSPVSQNTDTAVLINKLSEYQKLPTKHKKEIDAIVKQLDERGWK